MSSPLVTVGIPFYNASRWLFDAVKSAFAQTFTNWELILVDDGSSDGGVEIARSVCDPRVRVYSDGRNLQVAARRNQIVQSATGTYLAWLDADDMMHPSRLEKQIEFLERNPLVDVVGTGMYMLGPQGHVVGRRLPWSGGRPSCRPSHSPLVQPTVMGRIEWFRQNLSDPTLERAADMEMFLRTAGHSRFANLAELLTFYREYDSFSLEKYRLASRCIRRVIRRHGPRVVGRLRTEIEVAVSFLKPAVYAMAYYSGLHPLLLRRRSQPVSPEEKELVEAVLERIRHQELPLRRESSAAAGSTEKGVEPPGGRNAVKA